MCTLSRHAHTTHSEPPPPLPPQEDEDETTNLDQDTDSVTWQECKSKVSKLSPVESDAEFKTASEGDDEDDDKVMCLF